MSTVIIILIVGQVNLMILNIIFTAHNGHNRTTIYCCYNLKTWKHHLFTELNLLKHIYIFTKISINKMLMNTCKLLDLTIQSVATFQQSWP